MYWRSSYDYAMLLNRLHAASWERSDWRYCATVLQYISVLIGDVSTLIVPEGTLAEELHNDVINYLWKVVAASKQQQQQQQVYGSIYIACVVQLDGNCHWAFAKGLHEHHASSCNVSKQPFHKGNNHETHRVNALAIGQWNGRVTRLERACTFAIFISMTHPLTKCTSHSTHETLARRK